MKLIWLHGPPGAGKLTVAKALQSMQGYKLLHNHLTIDLSLAIYDHVGQNDFFDFTHDIRRQTIKKAQDIGVDYIVITAMTCAQFDAHLIEQYMSFFTERGIAVYPVQLKPADAALTQRVMSQDRVQSHKIANQVDLQSVLTSRPFLPIEHANTLTIDNSQLSPADVAQKIVQHIR